MSEQGHALGQRSRPATSPAYTAGLDGILLRITDGALAGCLFVVPMMMGGRQALGQLTLTALAVTAAVAWAARQCVMEKAHWRWSSAQWLLLVGVLLLVLQVAPLSSNAMALLAPHTSELLPVWSSAAETPTTLGIWSQISLTPGATRGALVIFLSYSLLFLVTIQRVQTVGDVERLLRWCGLSVLLMAAFGLVQLVAGNGKFFWFYEHPYTDTLRGAKGAFTNRNHFASFLALGIGPLIWWVQQGFHEQRKNSTTRFRARSRRSDNTGLKTSLRVIALGVALLAVLLSLSRGGALATLLATIIGVAVCYRASRIGIRMMGGLAGVGLLIVAALAIFGQESVSNRLDTLTQGSVEAIDQEAGRRTIWTAVMKAVPDFAWLGSGVGSHREVYPMYLESMESNTFYSHAECSPLQVLLESGVVGMGLVLAGVGFCAFWCVGGLLATQDDRVFLCLGAVTAGLAANVLHSAVDFIWYVPGCMAMVAVLAACACRLWQLRKVHAENYVATTMEIPRYAFAAGALALLIGGVVMVDSRIGLVAGEYHWEQCLRLDREALVRAWDREHERRQAAAVEEKATDAWGNVAQFAANETDTFELAMTEKLIEELTKAVEGNPQHARAHLRLAEVYVQLFHDKRYDSPNAMPLNQVRDAAIDNRQWLNTPEALAEWLARAIGERAQYLDLALRHARRSLELCPLHGESYLLLGQLCFLEGGGAESKAAYVSQAIQVRPYDGSVLFDAGIEAILAGEEPQAWTYWKQSFQTGYPAQRQLIDHLVGNLLPGTPGAEIDLFLETFAPNLRALGYLEARYSPITPPDQMANLWRAHARAAEAETRNLAGEEEADAWLIAMSCYKKLEDPPQRLRCAQAAWQCDQFNLQVRKQFALCLADQEQFFEAAEHLEWCLDRSPNDAYLKKRLLEATRGKFSSHDETATHESTWSRR